jgi:hypothetical protein
MSILRQIIFEWLAFTVACLDEKYLCIKERNDGLQEVIMPVANCIRSMECGCGNSLTPVVINQPPQ